MSTPPKVYNLRPRVRDQRPTVTRRTSQRKTTLSTGRGGKTRAQLLKEIQNLTLANNALVSDNQELQKERNDLRIRVQDEILKNVMLKEKLDKQNKDLEALMEQQAEASVVLPNSCLICCENWTSSGTHRMISLACGHLFGDSCIRRFFQTGTLSCPICRRRAFMSDIRYIYVEV
ncbi:E3 ubiquitin-protein ligase RFWD3-like [Drosophila madeirensis]|uniref:E3 ubiquitin-protein ligase RFWD3-like n=1 Tax=Drosophila madeirensis TaxID=30013 RepID=A0AAU9FL35_DROMD